MTGYTVHTGASKKFVQGWDRVFSAGQKKAGEAAAGSAKKSSRKGAAGKPAADRKKSG